MVRAVNIEQIEREASKPADPGLTTETHAAERMRTLIGELSKGSRQQLTEARDRIDDLMRALDRRGDILLAAVAEYASHVQSAVEMKGIIMDPISTLANDVAMGMDPAPGKTITQ